MARSWIPAFAGMTGDVAGMTGDAAGMTGDVAGMTGDAAGMAGDVAGMPDVSTDAMAWEYRECTVVPAKAGTQIGALSNPGRH